MCDAIGRFRSTILAGLLSIFASGVSGQAQDH